MVRVLAVSDVVEEGLWADIGPARGADLILGCGDLPFEYLGYLMNALDVPLVFVPGNHDPDLSGYRVSRGGLTLRAGLPARAPWPDGAVSADGRVVDVAGLRIAGLGGCRRYRPGPNQYSDRQQARRAWRLAARIRLRRPRAHAAGRAADPRPAARRGRRARPGAPGFSRPQRPRGAAAAAPCCCTGTWTPIRPAAATTGSAARSSATPPGGNCSTSTPRRAG